jgi:hypothetical protein
MTTERTLVVAAASAALCAALAACASCSKSAVDTPLPSAVVTQSMPEGEESATMDPHETFGDYRPKLTPDTVLDYRPGIGAKLAKLPEITKTGLAVDDFTALFVLLMKAASAAETKPGEWTQGAIQLGAEEKEYSPSDQELVAAILGERLREAIRYYDVGPVAYALAEAGVGPGGLVYHSFQFRHVDVMGSGRFFYASAPIERHLLVILPR